MAQNWVHDVDFRLYVKQAYNKTYQLTTLHSIDATLVTNAGVNQMRVLLHDPGQRLRNLTDAQGRLHPMQAIQLQLKNRHQQWGVAWTGYIDAVHYIFDVQQGDICQIMCTGPVKLWEITNTTPKSAYDLAFAYVRNAASSRILSYSCAAVGYPLSNLTIDPVVDSGTGFNNMITDVLSNPQAQQWSSIIQALQSNAGIEWFFDENGKSYWRQVGFLRVPAHGYRPVLEEDVISSDLAEADVGVVTKVSVRFNVAGAPYMATGNLDGPGNVVAQAPLTMIEHLHQRETVEYIPWLRSGSDGVPTATFLANFLLQQFAANVITGSVTIPADPMFRVGTVCEVPSLRGDSSTMLFYISSIAYALQWNGSWTMTLGLTYGHAKGQNFPYGEAAAYPTWTAADAAAYAKNSPSSYAVLPTDPNNPAKIVTVFQIKQVQGTPAGKVYVDPGYLPPGAVISLSQADGAPVGAQGYTVVKGATSTTPVLQVAPAAGLPATAYVTVVSAQGSVDTTAGGSSSTNNAAPNRTTINGTGSGTPVAPATPVPAIPGRSAPVGGGSFARQVLLYAQTLADKPGENKYVGAYAGPSRYDCSGLVAWCFNAKGMDKLIFLNYRADGSNADVGPEGVYNFFANAHGGVVLNDITQVQPGDLVFVHTAAAASVGIQQGFLHVGWAAGGGLTYGANHGPPGVGLYTLSIAEFHSGWGTTKSGVYLDGPINTAISMAGVTLASCLA